MILRNHLKKLVAYIAEPRHQIAELSNCIMMLIFCSEVM